MVRANNDSHFEGNLLEEKESGGAITIGAKYHLKCKFRTKCRVLIKNQTKTKSKMDDKINKSTTSKILEKNGSKDQWFYFV